MNRTCLVSLAAVCLSACTSYRDDVMTICDSVDKIGDTSKMKPAQKMALAGAYAEENVKSEKGKDFLGNFAGMGRGARNKMLRTEAAKLGINPCHLADMP